MMVTVMIISKSLCVNAKYVTFVQRQSVVYVTSFLMFNSFRLHGYTMIITIIKIIMIMIMMVAMIAQIAMTMILIITIMFIMKIIMLITIVVIMIIMIIMTIYNQVGYRVLGVQPNSPAAMGGLVSFFDFIVEAKGIPLKTLDSTFIELIKVNNKVELD
jgi:hypothetical protein